MIGLFDRMTEDEKNHLRYLPFDTLWNNLWVDNKRHHSNYRHTREKFYKLKNGFHLRSKDTLVYVSLDTLLDMSRTSLSEQEWDFPKGRRKLGEKDFSCALREFYEESNVGADEVVFYEPYKHFEEVYLSNNKVRYKNIYFIAEYLNTQRTQSLYDVRNITQTKEVRDVQWLPYDLVLSKLKGRHFEKTELFNLVNNNIKKKL